MTDESSSRPIYFHGFVSFVVKYSQYILHSARVIIIEECRLLGYGALYILSEPTFRRNVS
jgi:hypothetical protein